MAARGAKLARIEAELTAARDRAHALAETLSDELWSTRPAPAAWSVAECLAHLNLTSRAFVPLIERAIADARAAGAAAAASPRMDVFGRLLWFGTVLRIPVKTTEPFVPAPGQARDAVLGEFDTLQQQLLDGVARADGLPLTTIRIVSPFDARLHYNLYSAFRVIPAHQRLHLRQAGAALRAVRASLIGRR